MSKQWLLYSLVAALAVATACGTDTNSQTSPSGPTVPTSGAAADGSTFKITAPALSAPAEGSTADSLTPNLVVQNAAPKYAPQAIPTYQFVVVDSTNATVYDSGAIGAGASLTGHRIPANKLKADTSYRWHARGTSGSSVGPWSNYFSFKTPKS